MDELSYYYLYKSSIISTGIVILLNQKRTVLIQYGFIKLNKCMVMFGAEQKVHH